jgi:hypothetical protein
MYLKDFDKVEQTQQFQEVAEVLLLEVLAQDIQQQ